MIHTYPPATLNQYAFDNQVSTCKNYVLFQEIFGGFPHLGDLRGQHYLNGSAGLLIRLFLMDAKLRSPEFIHRIKSYEPLRLVSMRVHGCTSSPLQITQHQTTSAKVKLSTWGLDSALAN